MVSYGEQHWRTKVQSPPKILAKFWETEREKEGKEREREIMRGKEGEERPRNYWNEERWMFCILA